MKEDNIKKLKIYRLLSVFIMLMGLLLMTFMIVLESEPGGIPLLLIIIAAGWYFITRARIRSRQT